jgi:hypothetical protein
VPSTVVRRPHSGIWFVDGDESFLTAKVIDDDYDVQGPLPADQQEQFLQLARVELAILDYLCRP